MIYTYVLNRGDRGVQSAADRLDGFVEQSPAALAGERRVRQVAAR